MTTHVITVAPDTDVREIARTLIENRISAVPVVAPGERIVGIVSEGDLMRRSESGTERHPSWWLSVLQMPEQTAMNYVQAHGRHAADVMTQQVITVDEEASLESVVEILEKHRIKRVPVVRGDAIVGIVSRANLLHGLVARQAAAEPSSDDRRITATVKSPADAGVQDRLRARDVMTTRVVTVEPDMGIEEVPKRLLEHRISALPVVDRDGHLVGIVSEGDLTRRQESETERRPSWWLSFLLAPEQSAASYVKAHGRYAQDVMTRSLITVEDSTPIEEIAQILEEHHIKRVPVIREGTLVGIVSRADLLHGLVVQQTGISASMDDRKLKAAVEQNLSDAGVRTQLLNVVVSGGVVHVWGVVASPEEQAAVQVAVESVLGAKGARTNVEVLPLYMRLFVRAG
jgi:CBS domain-containing protein